MEYFNLDQIELIIYCINKQLKIKLIPEAGRNKSISIVRYVEFLFTQNQGATMIG